MTTTFKILSFAPLQIELPRRPVDEHIEGDVAIEMPPTHFVVKELPLADLLASFWEPAPYMGADLPLAWTFTIAPLEECKKPFTALEGVRWILESIDDFEAAHKEAGEKAKELGPLIK